MNSTNGLSLTKDEWLQPLLSAQYVKSRDQHSVPNRIPFSEMISQLAVADWLY